MERETSVWDRGALISHLHMHRVTGSSHDAIVPCARARHAGVPRAGHCQQRIARSTFRLLTRWRYVHRCPLCILFVGAQMYVWCGRKCKGVLRSKTRLFAEKMNRNERKGTFDHTSAHSLDMTLVQARAKSSKSPRLRNRKSSGWHSPASPNDRTSRLSNMCPPTSNRNRPNCINSNWAWAIWSCHNW